ncbi:MAG: hypothetical protein IKD93_05060 [Firmicutes bacterium]|nr:hypothetical protein [Bacillota bacterium]
MFSRTLSVVILPLTAPFTGEKGPAAAKVQKKFAKSCKKTAAAGVFIA